MLNLVFDGYKGIMHTTLM